MLGSDPLKRIRAEQIRPSLLGGPWDQLATPPRVIILPIALDAQADDAPQVVGLADLRTCGSDSSRLVRDGDVNDSPSRMACERIG